MNINQLLLLIAFVLINFNHDYCDGQQAIHLPIIKHPSSTIRSQPQTLQLFSEMISPTLSVNIWPTEMPPFPLTMHTSMTPTAQSLINQTFSYMTSSIPRQQPKHLHQLHVHDPIEMPRQHQQHHIYLDGYHQQPAQPQPQPQPQQYQYQQHQYHQASYGPQATGAIASASLHNSGMFKQNVDHIIQTLFNNQYNPQFLRSQQPIQQQQYRPTIPLNRFQPLNGGNYRISLLQRLYGNVHGYGHQPTTSFLGGSLYLMQTPFRRQQQLFGQRFFSYFNRPVQSYYRHMNTLNHPAFTSYQRPQVTPIISAAPAPPPVPTATSTSRSFISSQPIVSSPTVNTFAAPLPPSLRLPLSPSPPLYHPRSLVSNPFYSTTFAHQLQQRPPHPFHSPMLRHWK